MSFGAVCCQASSIPESLFLAAAEAVANSLGHWAAMGASLKMGDPQVTMVVSILARSNESNDWDDLGYKPPFVEFLTNFETGHGWKLWDTRPVATWLVRRLVRTYTARASGHTNVSHATSRIYVCIYIYMEYIYIYYIYMDILEYGASTHSRIICSYGIWFCAATAWRWGGVDARHGGAQTGPHPGGGLYGLFLDVSEVGGSISTISTNPTTLKNPYQSPSVFQQCVINPYESTLFHWIPLNLWFFAFAGASWKPKVKGELECGDCGDAGSPKAGSCREAFGRRGWSVREKIGRYVEDMWRACSDVATCCYCNLAGGFLVSYLSMPTLDALGWSPTERYFEMAGSTASHEICFGGKVLGVLLDLWMQMCSRVRKWGPYHWLVCSFGACAAGAVATVRATVGVFSCWQCLWCGAAEYAYKCYQSLW